MNPLERLRGDAFDRAARIFAAGWCAAPGCLHRIECYHGRPVGSPYCPLHR